MGGLVGVNGVPGQDGTDGSDTRGAHSIIYKFVKWLSSTPEANVRLWVTLHSIFFLRCKKLINLRK